MEPKKFPQVNAVFGADQPEYKPLPALITSDGYVVMCFQLSEDEKKRVTETGEIWISPHWRSLYLSNLCYHQSR